MVRVGYAGDSFLTGSAIAHALLQYAEALARAGQAATVEVPMVTNDGVAGRAEVLVGPASQIIATEVDTDLDELEDADLVDDLRERVAFLRSQDSPVAGPLTDETRPGAPFLTDYDF